MVLVNPGLYTDREKQDLDAVDYKPYRQSIYFEFNSSLRTSKTVFRLLKDHMVSGPIIINILEPFNIGGTKYHLGFPGVRVNPVNGLTIPRIDDIFTINTTALFGPYLVFTSLSQIFAGAGIGEIQKEEVDIVLGVSSASGAFPTRGSAFILLEYINMQRVPGYRR